MGSRDQPGETHTHTHPSLCLLSSPESDDCNHMINAATNNVTFYGSLPLQVLRVGFWVRVLLEVVADVHQHLPSQRSEEGSRRRGAAGGVTRSATYKVALTKSTLRPNYLSLQLRCQRFQKVIVFPVDAQEYQRRWLGRWHMAHHLQDTTKRDFMSGGWQKGLTLLLLPQYLCGKRNNCYT